VDDDINEPVSDVATITVENVPASAIFGARGAVNEGDSFGLSLTSPNDPSCVDTAAGFAYAFDCGDGNGYGEWGFSSSVSCPTDDNSSRSVKGQIRDKDLSATEYVATVTVNNVAPMVGPISIAPNPPVLAVGTTLQASAVFTDPGTADTHTAVWDWGDGTTSSDSVTENGGSGTASDTHSYAMAGVYTVNVTVTDRDGGVGTAAYQFVVVYDPDGGFVTGGGWIQSTEPTGKANLGFVAKYRNSGVLQGETEFQLKEADLNFKAESYGWLVIVGAKAILQGTGTVNGAGSYGFLVSVIDGAYVTGGSTDKFRIKIWDMSGGDVVVYDNQPEANVAADPMTQLAKGNIALHQLATAAAIDSSGPTIVIGNPPAELLAALLGQGIDNGINTLLLPVLTR
jgi:hypothetical protein